MEENTRKKATSRDIARECGVSQTTVSYVMNDTPGTHISEKTRRLVLETAKRLNYVPNFAARGMRMREARSIGLVVGRNAVNIGFNHVLRGIKRVMDGVGYSITLLHDETGHAPPGQQPEYLSYVRAGRIDGVVFCFCEVSQQEEETLQEGKIPYILADDNGVWARGQDVQAQLQNTIAQSVALCREKGWESACFFSFQYGQTLYSRKYDLFARLLAQNYPSMRLTRKVVQTENRPAEEVRAEILEHIRGGGFDLAVTSQQRMGLFVQNAIMQNRLQIPQYPKHICLDAAHMMQMIYPTVTSFDTPLTEIGEQSGRQILRLIDGKAPEQPEFRFSLKLGDSTT